MAGVKGRSGGARPNTGGPRPGSGRPRKKPVDVGAQAPSASPEDMLQLLKDIALGRIDASPTQVKAAIAAVAYTHAKKGECGKKDQRQEEANGVAASRFKPSAPPRLAAVGGTRT